MQKAFATLPVPKGLSPFQELPFSSFDVLIKKEKSEMQLRRFMKKNSSQLRNKLEQLKTDKEKKKMLFHQLNSFNKKQNGSEDSAIDQLIESCKPAELERLVEKSIRMSYSYKYFGQKLNNGNICEFSTRSPIPKLTTTIKGNKTRKGEETQKEKLLEGQPRKGKEEKDPKDNERKRKMEENMEEARKQRTTKDKNKGQETTKPHSLDFSPFFTQTPFQGDQQTIFNQKEFRMRGNKKPAAFKTKKPGSLENLSHQAALAGGSQEQKEVVIEFNEGLFEKAQRGFVDSMLRSSELLKTTGQISKFRFPNRLRPRLSDSTSQVQKGKEAKGVGVQTLNLYEQWEKAQPKDHLDPKKPSKMSSLEKDKRAFLMRVAKRNKEMKKSFRTSGHFERNHNEQNHLRTSSHFSGENETISGIMVEGITKTEHCQAPIL